MLVGDVVWVSGPLWWGCGAGGAIWVVAGGTVLMDQGGNGGCCNGFAVSVDTMPREGFIAAVFAEVGGEGSNLG